MDNAELYSLYNSMQRRDTEMVMSEFAPRLQWTENETVLDIGCGPGDVTMEILTPALPCSARLVGLDKSKNMIEHANKKYSNNQVEFKAIDFSTKHITDFFPEQTFTKIFSFYCLHWIQDQEQAYKNIFTLLKPGGYFLAVVAPTNSIFLVYKILSQMEKWRMYMQDVDSYIPRFYDSPNVRQDIENVVKEQGLEIITIEERRLTASFPSMQILMPQKTFRRMPESFLNWYRQRVAFKPTKRNRKQMFQKWLITDEGSNEAVNPFVKKMNESTREQYMACFEQVVEEQQLISETVTGEIHTQNSIFVIYGRRPQEKQSP